jgi:hypothetical protein
MCQGKVTEMGVLVNWKEEDFFHHEEHEGHEVKK